MKRRQPALYRQARATGDCAAFICACAVLLSALGLTAPARAIVGGQPETGPMARRMVQVGICSGIVLAPDVVLTAAHCASGHVRWRGQDGAMLSAVPAEIAVHPDYRPDSGDIRQAPVDLALLHWNGRLPESYEPSLLSADAPERNEAVTISGFGEAVPGQSESAGLLRSGAVKIVDLWLADGVALWVAADTPVGACKGDSGGAVTRNGKVVAVITSIMGRCGQLTRALLLGPQREWIDTTLAQWGRRAAWGG